MYYDFFEPEETAPMSVENYEYTIDLLKGLVEDIYETGNIENLEFHLEEILFIFGLKIPESTPQVIKKPTQKEPNTQNLLQNWVGYTRDYAHQFCKSS